MNRSATIITLLFFVALAAAVFWTHQCAPARVGAQLVFNMPPSEVKKITVHTAQGSFAVERHGQGWHVAGKSGIDRADNNQNMHDLLTATTELFYYDKIPAAEVVRKDMLDTFGLAAPKFGIELHGAGGHPKLLLFGREAALEGRLYARFRGSNDVLVIDDTLLPFTEKSDVHFRDSLLTKHKPSQVDAFSIRGVLGEIEIRRTPQSPQGWRITKPLAAPADAETVEKYLVSLLQAPIAGFVPAEAGSHADFGIEEGRNEVLFWVNGEPAPSVLRFGKTKGDAVIAQFPSRNMVVALPAMARQLVEVTPDHFRDPRLFTLDLEAVDRIRIHREGEGTPSSPSAPGESVNAVNSRSIQLDRAANGWAIAGKPVAPEAFNRMVRALAEARVDCNAGKDCRLEPLGDIEFLALLTSNAPETPLREHRLARFTFSSSGETFLVASEYGGFPDASGLPCGIVGAPVLEAIPETVDLWLHP